MKYIEYNLDPPIWLYQSDFFLLRTTRLPNTTTQIESHSICIRCVMIEISSIFICIRYNMYMCYFIFFVTNIISLRLLYCVVVVVVSVVLVVVILVAVIVISRTIFIFYHASPHISFIRIVAHSFPCPDMCVDYCGCFLFQSIASYCFAFEWYFMWDRMKCVALYMVHFVNSTNKWIGYLA